jgi:phosphopantothenoylcysteine decarboxylase
VQDLAEENRQAVRGTETDQEKLPRCHLWTDEDEWNQWQKVGDPILHIELRRWADVVLIAPCSADTLAKINGGICDNLLVSLSWRNPVRASALIAPFILQTSFLRALASSTPTLLFPAMNTLMWLHPLTARQISFVKDVLGYEVHGPIGKKLACGDLGQGAMYEWTDVVELVVKRFSLVPAEGHAEAEPVSVSTTPHTVTGISA